MAGHFLGDEGVEVHVVQTVPAATQGLRGVGRGAGGARAYGNARHGAAQAWKDKREKRRRQIK